MLAIKHLSKSFGALKALDDLSCTVPQGSILGLIGQNGSGKSTTFRLILNFLTPDSGSVFWHQQPITEKYANIIGYLPEERGLYPKISIEEQLIYFAKLRGKTKEEIVPQMDMWLEKFEVKGKKTDKVQSLSKGNQQKIQVIATLIHQPQLIILDEPFSGLDPVNAGLLKEAILECKRQGASIIFSSHNMEHIEQMCDHIVMLHHGTTVLKGSIFEIREQFGRTRLQIKSQLSQDQLAAIPGVMHLHPLPDGSYDLVLSDEAVGVNIFHQASQYGYMPIFNQTPPSLEEIFKMKAGATDNA